jgi:hypothetical protein
MEALLQGSDVVDLVPRFLRPDKMVGILLLDSVGVFIQRRIIVENKVSDGTSIATLHLGYVGCMCISWDRRLDSTVVAYIIGAKARVRNRCEGNII